MQLHFEQIFVFHFIHAFRYKYGFGVVFVVAVGVVAFVKHSNPKYGTLVHRIRFYIHFSIALYVQFQTTLDGDNCYCNIWYLFGFFDWTFVVVVFLRFLFTFGGK